MRTTLLALLAGALSALSMLLMQDYIAPAPHAPVLMTVDLQRLLTEQVIDVGHQKLPVEQQRAAAAVYARALSTALDDVARRDHAVLLVTPAVLRGAPDATDKVRERIRQVLDAAGFTPIVYPSATP